MILLYVKLEAAMFEVCFWFVCFVAKLSIMAFVRNISFQICNGPVYFYAFDQCRDIVAK